MKQFKNLLVFLILCALGLNAEISSATEIIQNDNGNISGVYSTDGYEEACLMTADRPAILKKVEVYLKGGQAGTDTLWLFQDLTAGMQPPTTWAKSFAVYEELIFEYTGEGFYEFDVSASQIQVGGGNRIAIVHHCGGDRPGIAYDDNPENGTTYGTISNYITDVYTPNPDFYGIAGTLMYRAGGHYLCRLYVDYFPNTNPRPSPVMVDVTKSAGLTKSDGNYFGNPMGSVVDFNQDGYDDFVSAGLFFKNNGDGTFSDVSGEIGISGSYTVWGDIDNDGNIDCFVNGGGNNDKIYKGLGDGTFELVQDTVVPADRPTVSPLLFDYNRDGLLDIYIAYGRRTINGSEVFYQDRLLKNTGGFTFEDVSESAGISAAENPPRDCWGATVCDYNRDGYPDIFVATYRLAPDFLYRNNGDGTFTEVARETGALGIPTSAPQFFGHGMGADFGDYDNDGDYDLIVGNLCHPDSRAAASNPSLIMEHDSENGKFINRTDEMRLLVFEMNGGIMFADLNNDSYLDIVHPIYSYNNKNTDGIVPNQARFYLNSGPDENYRMKDMTWFFGAEIHGSWAPVRLDYDNDGDPDVILNSNQEHTKLFENRLPNLGNRTQIRLVGDRDSGINSMAYGAEVIVEAAGKEYIRSLAGTISHGRTSQSTNMLHFGLGETAKIDKITVKWNNQAEDITEIKNPPINMLLKIGKDGLLDMPDTGLLEADVSPIDFGTVNAGETADASVTFTNIGTAEVAIESVSLTESTGFELIDNQYPEILLPDSSLKIQVRFAPVEKNLYTGTLLLESDAGNASVGKISLIGRGYAPSGEIECSPEMIDFEKIYVGDEKKMPILLANTGEADLTITGIEIPADMASSFSIDEEQFPQTIPVGKSLLSIEVTFSPKAEKNYIGNFIIESDAFENPEFEILVKGEGESRKAYISADVEELVFPKTAFGETSERNITISNSGSKELIISEFEFVFDKDSAYAVKDYNPPYSVPAGGESSFTITFSPIKTTVNRIMKIKSDATNIGELAIPIKGKGFDPSGIKEETDKELDILPNPADEFIFIDKMPGSKILIYDITGKILIEAEESQIDISELPNGVYFVRTVGSSKSKTGTFVKPGLR